MRDASNGVEKKRCGVCFEWGTKERKRTIGGEKRRRLQRVVWFDDINVRGAQKTLCRALDGLPVVR